MCLDLNWFKRYDLLSVKILFFMPEKASFQGLFENVSFDISEQNQQYFFK